MYNCITMLHFLRYNGALTDELQNCIPMKMKVKMMTYDAVACSVY